MRLSDFEKLLSDTEEQILKGKRIAVLGLNHTALSLIERLQARGGRRAVEAIYMDRIHAEVGEFPLPVFPIEGLRESNSDVIVVTSDAEKEDVLWNALPHIVGAPKIIVAGYGHFEFRDPAFLEIQRSLLVPSLANGYRNSLIHLYQCVVNAARQKLHGAYVEFGIFRGGTTMFVSRVLERLGANWEVIGFDTFDGFPERKSPLDMYAHPDCVFKDIESIENYLRGRNVRIIKGDIAETCSCLESVDIAVSFFDTDNFSATRAALEIVRERTLLGGAIVFDHYAGGERFGYTLGERMAAKLVVEDARYFHLHDTGVFFRQK